MPNYRRNRIPGGCYFFTVNLLERHNNTLLVDHIDLLRQVVKQVYDRYYFHINGWVVLPEHMHFIWTLPKGDDDYAGRIRLIKMLFSKKLSKDERRSSVRIHKGERGIWQRRYWEHTIRNERDYVQHMDYLHYNPVKHGYVNKVIDWPYSTFRRLVCQGMYPECWGTEKTDIEVGKPR
ncbi:MAG: transposase [Gammaproteobacteria bacterium]|nr:transposase [Gammaproteobacteria bacterium]